MSDINIDGAYRGIGLIVLGCSKTIYPQRVLLLEQNPNCAHQSLCPIDGLYANLGSHLEEMEDNARTYIVKD
jgi:hypothetical protein